MPDSLATRIANGETFDVVSHDGQRFMRFSDDVEFPVPPIDPKHLFEAPLP